MASRKQYLHVLYFSIILFIVFLAGLFLYTNQKKTTAGDIEIYQQFVDQEAKANIKYLNHIKGMTRQLSKNRLITKALLGDSNDATTNMADIVNGNLYNIAAIPDISAAFIMDKQGTCLFSSNTDFIGNNYGFRPYFKQALHTGSGLYTATGITSKKLGIYYALPIHQSDQIIGVAVIKFAPSFFNLQTQTAVNKKEATAQQALVGLAVSTGIFMTEPASALQSLSALDPETISQIRANKRFPINTIHPLHFPPKTWEKLVAQGFLHTQDQATLLKYHLFVKPLGDEDLFIIHIIEDSWFAEAYGHIRKTQQNILLVLYSTVFILIISLLAQSRRYQLFRETSEALIKEQNKHNHSLTLYKFIINNSPIAFWQIDPETKQIQQANVAFCSLIRQEEKDIIGKSIFDFYTDSSLAIIKEKSNRFNTGEILVFELKLRAGDGSQIPVVQHSRLARDPLSGKKQRFAFFTDLSEIKSQQEKLNIFNLALDQSDNSIIITNTAGEIEYANQSMLKTTGYSQQELLGQNPRILKSGMHPDSFYEDIWRTIKSGKRWRGKICNKRKDDSLFWEDTTISPVTNDANKIGHYLAIYIDVSKEMAMDEQLKDALVSARSATRAKSEFLANMSHEIRTPMSGVIGMTKLALGTDLNEKQKHYLNNVMISATGLLDLLNDILDFSKIEAEQLTLEKRNFNLEKVQNNIITSMQSIAGEKNLLIRDATDFSETPQFVIGDELRIRQILTNLLSNATKFTHEGEITLQTSVASQSGNHFNVTFTVSDTGIGIPAEKQQAIFANFTQVDTSTARQYGGTGLGLTISHQLVALMGGTLEVESRTKHGSRFYFTIPLERGSKIKTAGGEFDPKDNLNLSILMVEDNPINQEIALTVLETMGCTITIAENGLEALKTIAKQEFDAILMDIQMPILDGFCTSHAIRAYEQDPAFQVHGVCTKREGKKEIDTKTCHVAKVISKELDQRLKGKLANQHNHIIAMTANAMAGDKEKCLAVGMNGYLTKPFMPKNIYEVLCSIKPQIITAIKKNTGALIKEQITAHLKKIYNLNNEKISFLLAKSVETLKGDISALNEAWETENMQAIYQFSHKIKGALLNLGLEEQASLATKVESMSEHGTFPLEMTHLNDLNHAITTLLTALVTKP